MKKICIVYQSLTGNTKEIAHLIANCLKQYEVVFLNMDGLDANMLLNYDGILIGAFTWGRGSLHYDAGVFLRKLKKLNLSGKTVGCFGSGDHSFQHFCAAVDIFEEIAREQGAYIVNNGLKIHLAPESIDDINKCCEFAETFHNCLQNSHTIMIK